MKNCFIHRFSIIVIILISLCGGIVIGQTDFYKSHPWPDYRKSVLTDSKKYSTTPAQLFSSNTHLDTASFTLYSADFTGVFAGIAQWIDFDNDGDLDVFASGWDGSKLVTKLYRNDGGTFTEIETSIPGIATERGVAWGDFDNDGDYDLAITGGLDTTGLNPVARIYRNDGGTFTDIHAPLMPLLGGVTTWVDYNLDGKLDLLISGSPNKGGSFNTILYRNDDTTFTNSGIYIPGVWGAAVSWYDYDNDGDPDLLLTGYGDWGVTTGLFRNDIYTFTFIPLPFEPVNFSSISWGDFNNDGIADFVVSGDPPGWEGSNTYTGMFRGTGSGTFQKVPTQLPQLNGSAVAWGDYDNDGDLDLAINGWHDDSTNMTKIFRNDGDGVFTDIHADIPGTFWGSVAWGDVDNDGKLDLLISGGLAPQPFAAFYYNSVPWNPFEPYTAIYHNNLPVSNQKPMAPMKITSRTYQNRVTLSWNKATDDRTPQSMLTYNLRVGTSPGANDIVAPAVNTSTGFLREPKVGNNSHKTSRTLVLQPGKQYYWGVQTVDNTYAGSSFASEQSFNLSQQSQDAVYRTFNQVDLSAQKEKKVGKDLGSSACYTFFNKMSFESVNKLHLKFGSKILAIIDSGGFTSLQINKRSLDATGRNVLKGDSATIQLRFDKGDGYQVYEQWWDSNGVTKGEVFSIDSVERYFVQPNGGNVRDCIYKNVISSSVGLVIGIPQANKDSAKAHGWIRYKKSDKKYFSHSGLSRCFDLIADGKGGYKKFMKEQSNPHVNKHDNILLGELHALKLAIVANDNGITEPDLPATRLGDLIYNDTTNLNDQFNNLTLRQIALRADSALTYCSKFGPSYYNDIFLAIHRVNQAFDGAYIAITITPLKIAGTNPLPYFLHSNSSAISSVISYSGQSILDNEPNKFSLSQNYPNPFNPITTIDFSLAEPSLVTLKVYNLLGQEVQTLLNNETMEDGEQSFEFDANGLPSGVYFYKITAQGESYQTFNAIKKMMLVK